MVRPLAITAVACLLTAACLVVPARAQDRAPASPRLELSAVIDGLSSNLAELEARHHDVVAAADGIARLYQDLSSEVERVAAAAQGLGPAASSRQMKGFLEAMARLQEMNMSFNLQYLALQNQMQAGNRRFTAISNIMKTRHDTAKNAIQNVR